MNINIWTMWDNEKEFKSWLDSSPSVAIECFATVDNGKTKYSFECDDGKVIVTIEEFDTIGKYWFTIDQYLDTTILIVNDTLYDLNIWLFDLISGVN